MTNRILFPGNPWPNGHAIEKLEWSAHIEPKTGLWFHLELESAKYYAEDVDSRDDNDQAGDANNKDAWNAKIVWNNYHCCELTSCSGFLAATETEPLNFDSLATRVFHVDRLPVPDDRDERAFFIYLLGHDGVGDHRIRFTPLQGNQYALDWSGKIALEYMGSYEFNHEFHVQYDHLQFTGIRLPNGTKESEAFALFRKFIEKSPPMRLTRKDDRLWFVPS